ncbi:MAG: S1 RNA-binding domain-containing protein [Pirellulales bacterium]
MLAPKAGAAIARVAAAAADLRSALRVRLAQRLSSSARRRGRRIARLRKRRTGGPEAHVKQEMLINVSQPEECRIAIVENGQLEELYVERTSADNYVGNIYKGRVVNIEPSIQAAFIDFGVGRNGFLHISDLEPQYFRQGGFDPDKPLDDKNGGGVDWLDDHDEDDDDFDEGGSRPQRGPKRKQRVGARPRVKPPIQDVLRRGDELLVQVIKEGIGTKGPTLSTYISIPGRYLVLMPAPGAWEFRARSKTSKPVAVCATSCTN